VRATRIGANRRESHFKACNHALMARAYRGGGHRRVGVPIRCVVLSSSQFQRDLKFENPSGQDEDDEYSTGLASGFGGLKSWHRGGAATEPAAALGTCASLPEVAGSSGLFLGGVYHGVYY
jgi:hypothetical protein